MIPWEQVRAEALESGRLTQEAITRAKIEQDAHVPAFRSWVDRLVPGLRL